MNGSLNPVGSEKTKNTQLSVFNGQTGIMCFHYRKQAQEPYQIP